MAFQAPPAPTYLLFAGAACLFLALFRGRLLASSRFLIVAGWGIYVLTSPSAQFPRALRPLSVVVFGLGVLIDVVRRDPKPLAERRIVLSSRLLVAYLAFVFLGALASPYGIHNLTRWIEGVVIVVAAFYAVWLGLTKPLLAATGVACMLNISAAVLSGRQEITPGGTLPDGRLAGYMDPNHLAFAAAEVIIGVIWLWPSARRIALPLMKRFSIRPVLALCALISMYALLKSHSRTTLLGLVVGVVIAFYSQLHDRTTRVRVAFVAVVCLFLLVPFVKSEAGRYAARGESGASVTSLTGRTKFWPLAVDLIKQRPLIGWGIDVVESPAGAKMQAVLPGINQAHNAYLESALQAGLIGALAWALSLLAATVGSFRLPRDDEYRFLLIAVLLLTIIESITESSPAWFGDMFTVYVLALAIYSDRATVADRDVGLSEPVASTSV
jgi:hypothetical protein